MLEATANAWLLYDQLTRLSGSVTVAHPLAVKLISAARVKTDARDTIKLARGLSANLIPAVWVPPVAVRARTRPGHPSETTRQAAKPGSQSLARGAPASQSERERRGVPLRGRLAPGGSRFRYLLQSSCAFGRILCC